jgi:hypothetical protein
MSDQPELESLPVPDAPVNPPCRWCGATPTRPYEVEPAITGMKKQLNASGVLTEARVVKKAAVMAPACDYHRKRFDAQAAAREREKAKRAAERKKSQ